MNFRDLATLATDAPLRHGLRSGLCVSGIAVGVAAVLLLTSLGEGARRYVINEFVGLGANLVIVMPGKIETTGMPTVPGGTTRDLTIDDAIAVGRRSPAVARVAPVSIGSAPVERGDRGRSAVIVGTTPEYLEMRNLVVAGGRTLPGGDPRRGERVCILGTKVATAVFGGENPLGGTVRIGEWRFRVIGVLEPKGRMLGMDLDELVLVPVATALRLFNRTTLFRVLVQARSPRDVDAAREQAQAVLFDRHDRHEDFTVLTQGALMAAFTSILRALTAALAAIAGISLLVAGVGIMNVMLVAVAERTSEVGLEKALGARPAQILRLFLAEAVVIAAAGAVLGIALGALGVRVVTVIFPDLPARLQPEWLVIVVAIALSTGAAFGALPARRAARVEAALALARKA